MNQLLHTIQSGLTPAILEATREFIFGEQSVSNPGSNSDDLFMFIFWICTAVFAGLIPFYVYCVLRFRRKPGVAQERSPTHSAFLEVTWTVIPTIFLAVFFFEGFDGYLDQVIVESQAEEMDLEGYKWGWSLTYPNGAQSLVSQEIDPGQLNPYPIFVVPEDWPVKLRMSSRDVIHSFWIPDLRQKFDLFPNRYTSYQFRLDPLTDEDRARADENFPDGYRDHNLFCAEYCGDSHSEMAAIIRVASRKDYATWAQTGGIDPSELTTTEAGKIYYTVKGCAACHSVDGSAGAGPSWQNIYGYEHRFANGTSAEVDDNYIRESILVPGAKIREGYGNNMQSYQGKLNDFELDALIAYIRSLSDRAPASLIDSIEGGAQDDESADESADEPVGEPQAAAGIQQNVTDPA